MVSAPLHVASMDQVCAPAGDDVAAAHVHCNAHHAVGGDGATGRGNHSGDMGPAGLGVKVGPSAILPIELGVRVVGVGRSAGGRWHQVSLHTLETEAESSAYSISIGFVNFTKSKSTKLHKCS